MAHCSDEHLAAAPSPPAAAEQGADRNRRCGPRLGLGAPTPARLCAATVEVARRYMRSADLWKNNVTEKVMRLH